ncbi:hypothetical protein G6F43_012066 [Rhizopus delemar]|nr:hypothetical protein G6F43_012066 [Rhizopus delemar]
MDRNVADHKIDTIVDLFELMENITQSGSQKRLKDKGKATDSEVTTTSSTGISTSDEPTVFNKIALEDYDLEYSSDDFDAPIIKRPFLGESTKSSFRITKPTFAAVESSLAILVPVLVPSALWCCVPFPPAGSTELHIDYHLLLFLVSPSARCPPFWVSLCTILWQFDHLCNPDGDYTHDPSPGLLWHERSLSCSR